jgi:transposase
MIMILDLHRQGLSVSAIARASGFDRNIDALMPWNHQERS